jgi:[ribosomal protein S5]-alanine N-acetyltransferase
MIRLETERLTLRDWAESDIDDLIEGLNDLEVAKWLAFIPHPYTGKDAAGWLQFCIRSAEEADTADAHHFAIELKSERKVIGGVSLDRIDKIHGTAGGGIWINSRYQRNGYGSEAFGEKIRFAFEDLKLRRLDNGYFADNPASFPMQEKFGYKVEGLRRKAFRCMADGQLKDECLTGLLIGEWKK